MPICRSVAVQSFQNIKKKLYLNLRFVDTIQMGLSKITNDMKLWLYNSRRTCSITQDKNQCAHNQLKQYFLSSKWVMWESLLSLKATLSKQ